MQRTQQETQIYNSDTQSKAGRVQIIYYTDPLCCWSWGFEQHWQRLLKEYADEISYRYCMGGLLADWNNYKDTMNAISRPVQMGPLWLEVHHITGAPLNDRIWISDPPASSYPACVAVKCAQKQSPEAGEIYLKAVRKALMIDGLNIAKKDVLINVAKSLNTSGNTILSFEQFERDLVTGAAIEDFKKDLQEASYRNITRFPTLTISNQQRGLILTGYRPYEVLLEAFGKVASHDSGKK